VFGYLALALGIAFEIVGLVGLFTTSILTLVVLTFQALWVVAAAISLLVRAGKVSNTAAGHERVGVTAQRQSHA
jgi:hypothetical protein